MSESLQDQLMSLGLAKSRPKKAAGKKRRSGGHKGRKPAGGAAGKGGEISLDAAYRARRQSEKDSAEQARAEKRARDLERRRINTQIEAELEGKALNDRQGELKRNFLYKDKIRSVRVNGEQLQALNEGALSLVFLRGDYLLVEPEVAERVRALSPEHVPEILGEDPGEEEFPVPDDIVW